MATTVNETLKARYAALQAERERSWPPAQLEGNARQRKQLLDRFDPAAVAQPGTALPPLSFVEVGGDTLGLDELTSGGAALFLFFRYAGCPACNIALPYYADALFPGLRQRGIPLVALSPQPPLLLREVKTRHDLPFLVATDADNALARLLNISFQPDHRPSPPPAGWIGEVTGTGSWELPQPAFLLVGAGRVLRWLQVSPDWLDRPEAETVLHHVDQHIG
ncbi:MULTISPECIES: peroxiredoxin-like family protein [Sphingobium]|jgi:peroxiredoxin|uniref:AhpC/TSA family protein n=2 Tax=Sphingobium fuliginis (strain ATCC 27551) TaxID=336203 RepID=A0A7M2GM77_SPHSA|nr:MULTISPECIES: peroxiredoxin-like family protein [Sphingobium]AJR23865.1 alkyl hydroperoxide reductase [Sphingobium sp. YBL2]QDC39306.1 AhpC/TSA family protein [Sphingobium fuliginis ATCC 27551]QOT73593.1 AhpC/TSA family protein [Sphingobium fuliginis]